LVAIAFADSSIVVLALPQLYSRFETSITGVSWIVTSYNAAVAVTALALVFFVHRFRARLMFIAGALLFLAASIACASAQALWFLIVARCAQGAGAGLLLGGALSLLAVNVWTLAGTFGAALGPALGGILTQLFDWRAIFIAPGACRCRRDRGGVAAGGRADRRGGLAAGAAPHRARERRPRPRLRRPRRRALPRRPARDHRVAVHADRGRADCQRPAARGLRGARAAAQAGRRSCAARRRARRTCLAAVGERPIAMCALALCGVGLGIAVPPLSNTAPRRRGRADPQRDLDRRRPPSRPRGRDRNDRTAPRQHVARCGRPRNAEATQVLLDAPIGITDKVPIALDLRKAFNQAKTGEIPNLKEPFDSRGARSDPTLAAAATTSSRRSRTRSRARFAPRSSSPPRSRLPARWSRGG
jgi:hypothetical protein